MRGRVSVIISQKLYLVFLQTSWNELLILLIEVGALILMKFFSYLNFLVDAGFGPR
jgi:hypothetical protein